MTKRSNQSIGGGVKVYSAGNIVTYYVDAGVTYKEEVDSDASCLTPKTFTPTKAGWEFVGWREDQVANGSVLGSKVMGDSPVTLYAVFNQTIILSYSGNGNTSGFTAAQTGQRYYNNGNAVNPSFTLIKNGFSRSGASFLYWAMGSVSGSTYNPNAIVTLTANTAFYAKWKIADAALDWTNLSGYDNAAGCYRFGPNWGEASKVLYNINTSLYSGYKIYVPFTDLTPLNNTSGWIVYAFKLNEVKVRMGHTTSSSDCAENGTGKEYTEYAGYHGKSFTLTVNNVSNISIYNAWCKGTIYGHLYGGTITLIGKIV